MTEQVSRATQPVTGEARFTAGPWFVSGVRATIDRQAWLRVLQETPARELAFVPYSDRTDALHIEAHANAKLIAAAPDMLAALQNIRTAHATGHNEGEAGAPIPWTKL